MNLYIKYKICRLLLLQSAEKEITIFLREGISDGSNKIKI